jgi:prolyl-tRNA synthetase
MVIAKDTTETSSAAIGKLLNMKDLRLAQEELVKEVLPGCQGKGGRESCERLGS